MKTITTTIVKTVTTVETTTSTSYDSIHELIETISPTLRKFAAHHSNTQYAHTFDGLAPEAQELYQHAVTEILRTCKPDSKKSYLLNLADWRMRNATKTQRNYSKYVTTGADMDNDNMTEEEMDSVMEMIADDQDDPEAILIQAEAAQTLREIVENLAPEYQVVISLLTAGFDVPEITRKLGVTRFAMNKRMRKIRETFAQAGMTPVLVLI